MTEYAWRTKPRADVPCKPDRPNRAAGCGVTCDAYLAYRKKKEAEYAERIEAQRLTTWDRAFQNRIRQRAGLKKRGNF